MGSLEGAVLKASVLNFARADGRCQPTGGPDETWRATGSDPAPWTLAAGGEPGFQTLQPSRAAPRFRSQRSCRLTDAGKPAASWFDRKFVATKGRRTATVTVAGEKSSGAPGKMITAGFCRFVRSRQNRRNSRASDEKALRVAVLNVCPGDIDT